MIDGALATIVASIIAATTAVMLQLFAIKRTQDTKLGQIELKVDGRLESALEKIDALQETVSKLTGDPAPPPVAGQSGHGPTSTSE